MYALSDATVALVLLSLLQMVTDGASDVKAYREDNKITSTIIEGFPPVATISGVHLSAVTNNKTLSALLRDEKPYTEIAHVSEERQMQKHLRNAQNMTHIKIGKQRKHMHTHPPTHIIWSP